MDTQQASVCWPVLVLVAIVWCEEIDHIVDCSACQHTPVVGVKSYSCYVRCDVRNGEYKRYK